MQDVSAHFESSVTADQLDQAASSFVHGYLLRRYGRWLIAACLVNFSGFAVVLWLGGVSTLELAGIGFMALLGPAFLLRAYLVYPKRFAASLKQRLIPPAKFFVSSRTLGISTQAGAMQVPWSKVRRVLDFPAYYLVVFSPFAITVISKASLPSEAQRLLYERSNENAA